MKTTTAILKFFIISLLSATFLYAQNTEQTDGQKEDAKTENTETDNNELTDPEGSYLDKYHAKVTVKDLKDENLKKIYTLRVMNENFGQPEGAASFDQIKTDYKDGIKLMYKHRYLEASRKLEKNKKDISDAYKVHADNYRNRTAELLNTAADQLVELELGGEGNSRAEAAYLRRKVRKVQLKLIVAYGQVSMGESFELQQQYAKSIPHYRLAKLHAIHMLAEMAATEEDRKKILDQYQKDLADADNRIYTEENAS